MKNLKNLKLKEFLLEKGERVGLIAAGVVLVLLLALTLFRPGKGLFSGSAKANAKELDKLSDGLTQRQNSARPGPADLPGPKGDIATTYQVKYVPPEAYKTLVSFFPSVGKDSKRQQPEVFLPEEFQVGYVRGLFPSLHFQPDDEGKITKVWVLKNGTGAEGTPMSPPGRGGYPTGGNLQKFLNRSGADQAFNRQQPGPRGTRRGNLRNVLRRYKPIDLSKKIELVAIGEAAQRSLATEGLPQRMVIVEASFPYKKQVEEFREKLRLNSHGAVLTELVQGEKGKTWSSFQFRGLIIERMTMGRDGKPGTWEKLDIDARYKPLVIATFRQYVEEGAKMQPILKVSRGLIQRLPKQYKGKRYPKLAKDLKSIQETLAKLETTDKKDVLTPTIIDNNFNSFDDGGANQQNTGGNTRPMSPMIPPPTRDGQNMYGNIAGTSNLKETPIDYCLIRFVDLAIEPGQTYKYRFKVKMANPNYSTKPGERKDTYVQFARKLELVSKGWAYVPQAVTIPADDFLYFVDQAKVKKDPLRVGFGSAPNANQAVFQIQRWIESYYRNPKDTTSFQYVGEWVIARRFFVERGEFVKTNPLVSKVEVPVRKLGSDRVDLDERPGRRERDSTRMPVPFGDESILIDFEGGRKVYHKTQMVGETLKKIAVEDESNLEVLIMRPDGKLIARDRLTDEKDPVRIKRYSDYQKLIEYAKNPDKKPKGEGPFGEN